MFSRLPWRLARLGLLLGLVFILIGLFIKQSQGNYPEAFYWLANYFQFNLPYQVGQTYNFRLSRSALVDQVNQLRQDSGLAPLAENQTLNQAAELVLSELIKKSNTSPKITDDLLNQAYKQVGFKRYRATVSNFVVGPEFMFATPSGWLTTNILNQDLKNQDFTQFGLASSVVNSQSQFIPNQYAVVFILASVNEGSGVEATRSANPSSQAQSKLATIKRKTYVSPTPIRFPEISDIEVVEALNRYRAAHKVHQLVIDQNLCEYAQKRVQDLIKHGGLDNHEGFKRDFDVSSHDQLPEPIKRYSGGTIGENLAYQYCRNMKTGESFIAQTGTALIEWCFDSSTKGHREAQLNPRYNAVCVRHANGYYVVIFGE